HRDLKETFLMNHRIAILLLAVVALGPLVAVQGADKPARKPAPATANEADYYKLLTFTPPANEVLEAGALEMLPDGRVALGTRRGEVWLIDNAYDDDPGKAKFTRFAHGLHEVLGLAAKDDWLYVVQRPDVTRIKDTNGDGKADVFECVTDGWEING